MSGWYPDPTGRFEYRYHNDLHWTADVANAGRRYVDPLPAPGAPAGVHVPGGPSTGTGNGIAIASMVCGITAVVIAWVPFFGILGLVGAIVGLALAVPALRRSRPTGHRRGAAITGLVTSLVGIVLGVVGIVLAVALVRAVVRYEEPGAHEATITSCVEEGAEVIAAGEITNRSDSDRSYSVLVRLSTGEQEWATVDDVPAGETAPFRVRERVRSPDGECRIVVVRGPTPLGLDPEVFEE